MNAPEPDEERGLPVSGGELTAAARAFGLLRKVFKRPDPQRIVEHRTLVKRELRQRLALPDWFDASTSHHAPEVLVFRLGQNTYPDVSYRVFRSDDWMKFEVKGLHDRGLEVFTGVHEVAIRNRKARIIEHAKKPPKGAHRTVIAVGRIPYERISHMDWDRDNAEMLPVLHVAYGRKGPIREWVPCELSPNHYAELPGVTFTRVPQLMGTWNGRDPVWLLGFGDFVRLVRVCPRLRPGGWAAQSGCRAVIRGGDWTPVAA